VLLLVYTVIPLPLYATLLVGISYTLLFEAAATVKQSSREPTSLLVNLLLHVCLHLVGAHILLMTQVRMRDTFMKVGQNLLVRRQLGMEKQLKEKMIHSVMPPKVSDWLMKGMVDEEEEEDIDSETGSMMRKISSPRSSNQGDIRTMFRPFNMNTMDNVSILFADIVGFTRMSSNKTASQLVGLLNDLFGRFDRMCLTCHCEKISTLGDCYYCVSGCPEPRVDHASNCVEMGLSMIKAIKDFDADCNESVNMRVGIHTGTVLCGIVGKKRFKFDVWSNDVTLANRMESSGKPGMVHISEKTYSFLEEEYYVQRAEGLEDMATYFITGRKTTSSFHIKVEGHQGEVGPPATFTGSVNNNEAEDVEGKGQKNKEPNIGTKSLPVLEDDAKAKADEGGRIIMNRLHKFLRQRSAPSSVPPPDPPILKSVSECEEGEKDKHANGNLQLPIVSKSNGCSPVREVPLDLEVSNNSIQASLADINNVYCNTGQTSNQNDIALTFQEIESQAASVQQSSNRGLTESLSRFHQLRKQSDLVLIRSVQEDTAHHRYFTRPPLHHLSCFFLEPGVETEYRRTAWKRGNQTSNDYDPEPTFASSSVNAYIDILVCGLVFTVVCLACLARYGPGLVWLTVAGLAMIYQLVVVTMCLRHLFSPGGVNRFRRIYTWCRGWYPVQAFGALLISLPIISLMANISCDHLFAASQNERTFYLNLLTVCLVHFCNFTQIYCYVKSLIASLFALAIVLVQAFHQCPCEADSSYDKTSNDGDDGAALQCKSRFQGLSGEVAMVLTMLLLLIWMLNREFEINYRLSYHCSLLAAKDRKRILNLKNQADWLLHNIIPDHVSDQLKKSAKYSENHKDVGIVFASLVNFNELYDESYMGGKEFLRVLNELISDFDELLDQSEFRNVEKIKTIGATFMAASGLNPFIREENAHKYQHLMELMEFAFALQRSVEDFNQSLIEFDLVLRIGVNYGDVTSGVIGNTKLYYDIWGDAVNIASRMDSTGVEGRIQVNERTRDVLKQWFEFEERGDIFVKGKDNMKVFLFTKQKESALRMF